MSTNMTWQTISTGPEDTEKLAEQLGAKLKGGEVIELKSDLGGGKTTFTRGLVKGTGSSAHVSSPTFTISNVYKAPNFTIYHFDFYRLAEAGLIAHELHDAMEDPKAVIVVEWGGVVASTLPPERISIELKRSGEEERLMNVRYPKQYEAYFSKPV